MKPEDVERPALFHITHFWTNLMGSGMGRQWIKSPSERGDSLGRLLKEVNERHFSDGYRVGSRWSGESKFRPEVSKQGDFHVDSYVNMDRDNPRYEEATKYSNLFEKTVRNFIAYVDGGDFDPEQVLSTYEELNQLSQEGYDLIKGDKRPKAKPKYGEVLEHLSKLNGKELQTSQRLDFPLFLYDHFALEAVFGLELAKTRSKSVLEEMDKEHGWNPNWKAKYKLDDLILTIQDGELVPYLGDNGLVQSLSQLPQKKKNIVLARKIHKLRSANDSTTKAYGENIKLSSI